MVICLFYLVVMNFLPNACNIVNHIWHYDHLMIVYPVYAFYILFDCHDKNLKLEICKALAGKEHTFTHQQVGLILSGLVKRHRT